jgi:hypothetical protein
VSKKPSRIVNKLLQEHKAKFAAARERGVPFSETLGEDRLDFTAQDCIDLLRGVAEALPEQVISRNFFRVHSGVTERTWNRYFGSFREYKRQANIITSRQVQKLELEIAKHASVDHYRKMRKELEAWAGKYLRPSSGRFQTILVGADFHDRECDPFALKIFIETAARAQPETIVLGGDIFDLPEMGKYTTDPRAWDVVGRIRFVHNEILAPLRAVCPKAQIDLIEGNHEARIIRHLADKTPSMLVILADLMDMKIEDLLGLKKYQVNYVAKADLASWTKGDQLKEIKRNFKVYHDCFLVHHFTDQGKAKQMPGVSGHSHKHLSWSYESPTFGSYEFHQMGAMHIRDATYTDGEKWSNGFALAHIDTVKKRAVIDYVPVGETMACVGGKFYFREA